MKRAILDLSGTPLSRTIMTCPWSGPDDLPPLEEIPRVVAALREEMHAAAEALEFEQAAALRDRIRELTDTELLLRDPGPGRKRGKGGGRGKGKGRGKSKGRRR